MNEAAKLVMTELPELIIAYGISDEYRYASPACVLEGIQLDLTVASFVFHKTCKLFERRER